MRFRPGDRVEFWSGEGRWKPGIVAPRNLWASLDAESKIDNRNQQAQVRIETGPGVWVTRHCELVRYAALPEMAAAE